MLSVSSSMSTTTSADEGGPSAPAAPASSPADEVPEEGELDGSIEAAVDAVAALNVADAGAAAMEHDAAAPETDEPPPPTPRHTSSREPSPNKPAPRFTSPVSCRRDKDKSQDSPSAAGSRKSSPKRKRTRRGGKRHKRAAKRDRDGSERRSPSRGRAAAVNRSSSTSSRAADAARRSPSRRRAAASRKSPPNSQRAADVARRSPSRRRAAAAQQGSNASSSAPTDVPARRVLEFIGGMFRLVQGLWQFVLSPLVQPKRRTGAYVRPGAGSDVRCSRCRGKGRGVHDERCPDDGVYVDVFLCPDCGYTCMLLAEYQNHARQCHEAMSEARSGRRRVERRDPWTPRKNLPMLFWCGRSGCRYKSHIKALAWAHEPLCYLQTMHFAPAETPYPLLPNRHEMTQTDEDIWNFTEDHRRALRGIQRFLASAEGVRLWTACAAGQMPSDRSALPQIPGLRPALRDRLPTEAQRTAHLKKSRSPSREADADESPTKRRRGASASARQRSPAARSPRRRERSADRRARGRSPPASRRHRSPTHDRPTTVNSPPLGLSDFPGSERFMPAGSEGRPPLPRGLTASTSTVTTPAPASGARPRTDRRAAGDMPPPPPPPPVSEMARLSIVGPPPGLYQYIGVLYSLVSCRATAHVRVRGVLTTGVGEVLLTPPHNISCYFGDSTVPPARDPDSLGCAAIAYLHGNMPPYLPAGRLRFSVEPLGTLLMLQFPSGAAELEMEPL